MINPTVLGYSISYKSGLTNVEDGLARNYMP